MSNFYDAIKNKAAATAAAVKAKFREDAANTNSDEKGTKAKTYSRITYIEEPEPKKADLRISPGKEWQAKEGRLVNATPSGLSKNLEQAFDQSVQSGKNSNTSKESKEGIQYEYDTIRSYAAQRKMRYQTQDNHLHALAILIGLPIDFDVLTISLKTQMMNDIQAIVSSPSYNVYAFANKHALGVILKIISSFNVNPANLEKKQLLSYSKQAVAAITKGSTRTVENLDSGTWNQLCNLLGVFIPNLGFPAFYKTDLVAKLQEKVLSSSSAKIAYVNTDARDHLNYYYGFKLRPVGKGSLEHCIPAFNLDLSFNIDTRRGTLGNVWKQFKDPGNPLGLKYGTSSWCSSCLKCVVDIWPAPQTVKCDHCKQNVHAQCASYSLSKYTCASCLSVPIRRHWYAKKELYITLPDLPEDADEQPYVDSKPESSQVKQAPCTSNEPSPDTKSDSLPKTVTVEKSGSTKRASSNLNNTVTTSTKHHASQLSPDANPWTSTKRTPATGKIQTEEDPDAMAVDTPEDAVNPVDNRDEEQVEDVGSKEEASTLQQGANALLLRLQSGGTAPTPGTATGSEDVGSEREEIPLTHTRYDLMFKLPAKREATDELTLIAIFTGFVNAMQTTDEHAVISPWKIASLSGPLNMANLLPDYDNIQVYFPRARINTDNEKVYSDIRIAHSVSRATLEMGVRSWLLNNNASLYHKHLQVEMTKVVGWFMWSHRYIKAEKLAHVLASEHNVHGHFRFNNIYLGKEKFGPNQGVKALIMIVEWKDFDEATAILKLIYNQFATDFPLGISMRFMPAIGLNITENQMLKMQIWRCQHEDYMKEIKTAISTDIRLLDAEMEGNKSLRNFIMSMKHSGTKKQLFLSVDTMWNDNAKFMFAFVEGHMIDATRIVNTLAAYVLHKNSVRAEHCFTEEAIKTARTMKWDKARNCFMTELEMFYENMELWSPDVANMGVSKDRVTANMEAKKAEAALLPIEKPPSRAQRLHLKIDTDSVGTVSSRIHSKRLKGAIEEDTDAGSIGGDTISTTGTTKKHNSAMAKEMIVMKANQLESARVIFDLTAMLEAVQKQVPGYDASNTPAPQKSIRIQESSATETQPSTGVLEDSGARN